MLDKNTAAKIVKNWKKNGKVGGVEKQPDWPFKLIPKVIQCVGRLEDEGLRKLAENVANEVKRKACTMNVLIRTIRCSLADKCVLKRQTVLFKENKDKNS